MDGRWVSINTFGDIITGWIAAARTEVNARSMVFETGDLVVGWGRLVVDADGVWLDLARSMPLPWPSRDDGRSAHSVRLIGADVDRVPKEFGPDGAIPGRVTITGIWRDDVIKVRDRPQPDHADDQIRT